MRWKFVWGTVGRRSEWRPEDNLDVLAGKKLHREETFMRNRDPPIMRHA